MRLRANKRSSHVRLLLPVLFLASLVVLGAGALVKGPFVSSDTPVFLNGGEDIVNWLTCDGCSVDDFRRPTLVPQYVISSLFLAGIYTYLDLGEWGVMVVNSLLFAFIVCAIFIAWRALYRDLDRPWANSARIVGLCGGLYAIFGLPDGFLWSYAILTDLLFLFWITVFTVLVIKGFLERSRTLWILAFLVAITAVFVRPPGIVVPLLYGFALALHLWPVSRRGFKYLLLAVIVVPAALVLVVVPYLVLSHTGHRLVFDPRVPDFIKHGVLQAVIYLQDGVIIGNRVEIDPNAMLSYGDILKTIAYRLGYYWVPLRFGQDPYSAIHNLANGVYMLFAVPFLLLGVKHLATLGEGPRAVALFLIALAYSFALLHSVTLVSFDWRYQLPAMVPLWILVGCGLFACLGFRPWAAVD